MYVLAAIGIFAAAAAVAVVQATGSDDAAEQEAAQTTVSDSPVQSSSQQSDAQQSTASTETVLAPDDAETATPNQPSQTQQRNEAEQEPVTEVGDQTEEAEADAEVEQQAEPDPAFKPIRIRTIRCAGSSDRLPAHASPSLPVHLPGSARTYRNHGVHEGLDFYEWASCTAVNYTTEILAAKAGVIIRADLDYVEITPADWQRFIDANWEGEQILDELRGRQVWIDHGRGVVTRYAHLSEIAEGIAVGVEVLQGQLIGYPGESGQQEVYANPGTDIHLHFEIRVGDGWLGQGETPAAARTLYLQAFGLAE